MSIQPIQIQVALNAFEKWDNMGVTGRLEILKKSLTALNGNHQKMAEWQLNNAQKKIAATQVMPGPTGERNELSSQGRGPFLCLNDRSDAQASIGLIGQVYAALIAGNPVITAELEGQTLVDNLLIDNVSPFVPEGVIQNVAYDAVDSLLEATSLAGVAIVCDVPKAQLLNKRLAEKDGLLCQLIPEISESLSSIAKPNYILNFITEKTVSINTTAIGGNATLLELGSKAD